MKTEIRITDLVIDNIKEISKELLHGKNLNLVLFDSSGEKAVGMWLEHIDTNKDCTIMISLTKEEALFIGKSLVAIAENI